MEIIKLTFNEFYENTYILFDETNECIIVDPGNSNGKEDIELEDAISERKLKPVMLINTHCHLDHVFGNGFVYDKWALEPLIHEKESPLLEAYPRVCEMYGVNHRPSPKGKTSLIPGDVIGFGNTLLKILFAPGHSPGSVCLYSEKSNQLMAGDVLFRESIGRTDLPGGNHEQLLNSIKNELFTLPDHTIVYSGHGENTQIGYEKKNNPFFD